METHLDYSLLNIPINIDSFLMPWLLGEKIVISGTTIPQRKKILLNSMNIAEFMGVNILAGYFAYCSVHGVLDS